MKLSIKYKLTLLLLLFSSIPLGIIGYISYKATELIEEKVLERLIDRANTMGNKIDRLLFERYVNTKTFAQNDLLIMMPDEYQLEWQNKVTNDMNRIVDNYNSFYLTLLVDTSGNVLAVNTVDENGQDINTKWIYDNNYKDTVWFKQCMNETFTKSREYTIEENAQVTGVYVEDVHVDPDVQRVYPSSSGLTLGFS